ncbi:hypothetical protein BaRGS_00010229, partial [Batillaria attramentaria]
TTFARSPGTRSWRWLSSHLVSLVASCRQWCHHSCTGIDSWRQWTGTFSMSQINGAALAETSLPPKNKAMKRRWNQASGDHSSLYESVMLVEHPVIYVMEPRHVKRDARGRRDQLSQNATGACHISREADEQLMRVCRK